MACERTAPSKYGVSTATQETPLDPPLFHETTFFSVAVVGILLPRHFRFNVTMSSLLAFYKVKEFPITQSRS